MTKLRLFFESIKQHLISPSSLFSKPCAPLILVVSLLLASSCDFAGHDIIIGEEPQGVEDSFVPDPEGFLVETWQENLDIPWQLVFLPDGNALVSERGGRILFIEDGNVQDEPYAELDVRHSGEGGLMGLALHPDFPDEPYVYAMHTHREAGRTTNRVVRLHHENSSGELDRVLISDIPGGRFHNGGRLAFGPDDLLYVTTGDVFQAPIAQNADNPGGKILRITPEGDIPEDNPFPDSKVYTLGHRNPQGLAWHPETGDLFSSEHGPSGEFGLSAKDMVNIIFKGENYGWPRVIGAVHQDAYIDPVIFWKDHATPPGGMTFFEGDLFLATMRSEALIRIGFDYENHRGGSGESLQDVQDSREPGQKYSYRVERIERWFAEDWSSGRYGRFRDAVAGPDDALYVLTTNRDGRGQVREGDDRILRITNQ